MDPTLDDGPGARRRPGPVSLPCGMPVPPASCPPLAVDHRRVERQSGTTPSPCSGPLSRHRPRRRRPRTPRVLARPGRARPPRRPARAGRPDGDARGVAGRPGRPWAAGECVFVPSMGGLLVPTIADFGPGRRVGARHRHPRGAACLRRGPRAATPGRGTRALPARAPPAPGSCSGPRRRWRTSAAGRSLQRPRASRRRGAGGRVGAASRSALPCTAGLSPSPAPSDGSSTSHSTGPTMPSRCRRFASRRLLLQHPQRAADRPGGCRGTGACAVLAGWRPARAWVPWPTAAVPRCRQSRRGMRR